MISIVHWQIHLDLSKDNFLVLVLLCHPLLLAGAFPDLLLGLVVEEAGTPADDGGGLPHNSLAERLCPEKYRKATLRYF